MAAVVGLTARGATAGQSDYFHVAISNVIYGGGVFRVTADAVFDLQGCFTRNPNCREIVRARFELRRNGRLVSSKQTQTFPGFSSLGATLPTFMRCRRPGPLTPAREIVQRTYFVTLRARAYTGRTALVSRRSILYCRR